MPKQVPKPRYNLETTPQKLKENSDQEKTHLSTASEVDPFLPDGSFDLVAEQGKDKLLSKLILFLSENILPKSKNGQAYVKVNAPKYYMKDRILCFKREFMQKLQSLNNLSRMNDIIAVPHSLKLPLLISYHDSLIGGGHFSYVKVYERLMNRYYWPEIKLDTYEYTKGCYACGSRKSLKKPLHPPLRDFPPVVTPASVWLCDHAGPFPASIPDGYTHILSFVDEGSHWPEVFCVRGTKAIDVARIFMQEIVARYGSAKLFRSDNSTSFKNELMQNIFRISGTKHILGAPRKPSSQGVIERFNAVLYQCISMYINDKHSDWNEILPYILMAARSSFNRTTQESPAYLFLGRDLQLPIENAIFPLPNPDYFELEDYAIHTQLKLNTAWELAKANLEVANEIQRRNFNEKRLNWPYKFHIGMKVFVKGYKQPPKGRSKKFYKRFQGPFRINDISNLYNYHLRLISNPKVMLKVSYQRLKPYFAPYFPKLRTLVESDHDSDSEPEEESIEAQAVEQEVQIDPDLQAPLRPEKVLPKRAKKNKKYSKTAKNKPLKKAHQPENPTFPVDEQPIGDPEMPKIESRYNLRPRKPKNRFFPEWMK
jgi:transposase InsO family protein